MLGGMDAKGVGRDRQDQMNLIHQRRIGTRRDDRNNSHSVQDRAPHRASVSTPQSVPRRDESEGAGEGGRGMTRSCQADLSGEE